MYGIPCQARTTDTAGRELDSTGRLISGSHAVNVMLRGEPDVVVLINASNSGTVRDFTIGCGR